MELSCRKQIRRFLADKIRFSGLANFKVKSTEIAGRRLIDHLSCDILYQNKVNPSCLQAATGKMWYFDK